MMVRALWTAATGMHAQQRNIDVIAHDLTNVNTNGYKKTHVNFADLFYQRLRSAGVTGTADNNLPTGLQVGNGVRTTGTTKIFTIGGALETLSPLNMMIMDKGNSARNFFPVDLGDGRTGYTRDGAFSKDDQGNIVNNSGHILSGAPTIPADAQDISITADGRILYRDAAGAQAEAGQIQLSTFANPAGLEPMGDNVFLETTASGAPATGTPGSAGYGEVKGGWVEISNVSAIEEMVNMISAQRAYEFNSKTIQTSDEMLQTVNNLKR
ncbi:MAG: flagellar basal-body rod protein FlgG [Planctomycetota bacterium]|jgi:flagellar basal-body rod protein FlgG